jgi:hypothetical protein
LWRKVIVSDEYTIGYVISEDDWKKLVAIVNEIPFKFAQPIASVLGKVSPVEIPVDKKEPEDDQDKGE